MSKAVVLWSQPHLRGTLERKEPPPKPHVSHCGGPGGPGRVVVGAAEQDPPGEAPPFGWECSREGGDCGLSAASSQWPDARD